ncbi:family 16 glycosylhydrolase [candidate division KSB1 bacterium]|nr:family 16 glycosylhydrolase [candidate division KSB1 bacterium]
MKSIFKKMTMVCLMILLRASMMPADELVWYDEFDGTTIDPAKWDKPEYNRRQNSNGPDGWWLREESFLDGDGHLIIRARRIANRNSDNDPYDYATGAIRSYGKFEQKFGRFEVSCRLPRQPGWWVAYWLYSDSVGNENGSGEDGTEIDIFEGFGWTDEVQHALHWDGYGDAHQVIGHTLTMEEMRTGFHTFTLEWYENLYVFYVDGIETWRTDAGGVSKVPAYVKVTGELSTESWAINTNWANDPTKAVWPDSFIIDYVRVYELDATVFDAPTPNDHLAYRKTAGASSDAGSRYSARRATDGNISSRWQSAPGAPQWLTIDLLNSYLIHKVRLDWAAQHGVDYRIEVADSIDGPWTECIHVTGNGQRGSVTHEFEPRAGRFVRLYGLQGVDDGGFSLYEMAVYGEENTAVHGKADAPLAPSPMVLQNYPNPFNAATVFRCHVPGGRVRLTIHNLAGQQVAALADQHVSAGDYAFTWTADACTSGIYLARLQTDNATVLRKVVLQK